MIKQLARSVLPERHSLFLGWSRKRFGLATTLSNYAYLLCHRGIARVPAPTSRHHVFVRAGTADQYVYDQIFHDMDYDVEMGDVKSIVDAGAHVGLASVFFASRYPEALVIAIEPEPSNFRMLLMNTEKYPNIKPIHAGLWSKNTYLHIKQPEVSNWAFQVVEGSSADGIPAICVQDIIARFALPRIDVLKVDIEGSEVEVLEHSDTWIGSIGTMIIELHDRFRPGCTAALTAALVSFMHEDFFSGENMVVTNLLRLIE